MRNPDTQERRTVVRDKGPARRSSSRFPARDRHKTPVPIVRGSVGRCLRGTHPAALITSLCLVTALTDITARAVVTSLGGVLPRPSGLRAVLTAVGRLAPVTGRDAGAWAGGWPDRPGIAAGAAGTPRRAVGTRRRADPPCACPRAHRRRAVPTRPDRAGPDRAGLTVLDLTVLDLTGHDLTGRDMLAHGHQGATFLGLPGHRSPAAERAAADPAAVCTAASPAAAPVLSAGTRSSAPAGVL